MLKSFSKPLWKIMKAKYSPFFCKSTVGKLVFCFSEEQRKRNQLNRPQNNDNDFIKPNLVKKDGIFIDQDRIKAKMKQIKQRTHMKQDEIKRQKQKQFMRNYQIVKDMPKVKKFRQDTKTEDLMSFQDLTLDVKPTIVQITSVSDQFIEVDGLAYPPSVIVLPDQAFIWQIKDIKTSTEEHFKVIEMITPTPSTVIIGCPQPNQIPERVLRYFQGLNVDLDIIESFNAISQFNVLALNQTYVIGFITTVDTGNS